MCVWAVLEVEKKKWEDAKNMDWKLTTGRGG